MFDLKHSQSDLSSFENETKSISTCGKQCYIIAKRDEGSEVKNVTDVSKKVRVVGKTKI